MTNRLDNFIPDLLNKIDTARRNNWTQFQYWHPTGDRIEVHLNGDRVTAQRLISLERDDQRIEVPRVKLATTVAELRKDVALGITSNQAQDFRG